MAKFSAKKTKETLTNYDGGKAFKHKPEMELVLAVLTTFLEDKYYEGKDKRIRRLKKLVGKVSAEFVAKLAVVARRDFHLRSVSHLLLAELAKIHRGDSLVSRAMEKAILRPDDLVEIVACLKKPIPKQVKRGIRRCLLKFDAYQLAKYKMEGRKVKLVDLFNLAHPNPKFANEEQKKAWQDLVGGELKNVLTWEARLSSGEDKAKVWEDLVANDKLGYMALLRNLRNILRQASKETVNKAMELIADKEKVLNSKQFPFRFLSAYLALTKYDAEGLKFEKDENSLGLVAALEKAIGYSVLNLPLLKGKTMILSDNSGSMRGDSGGLSFLSAKSKVRTSDVGNLFAVLYWTRCDNTLVGLFGDRLIMPRLDRDKGVFENFKFVDAEGGRCGEATETGIFEALERLVKEKQTVDRIVIFSDTQIGKGCGWYDTTREKTGDDFNGLFQDYRKINPDVKVYNVDLQGYGNTMIATGAYNIGGWSERIFTFMEWIEKQNELTDFIGRTEI